MSPLHCRRCAASAQCICCACTQGARAHPHPCPNCWVTPAPRSACTPFAGICVPAHSTRKPCTLLVQKHGRVATACMQTRLSSTQAARVFDSKALGCRGHSAPPGKHTLLSRRLYGFPTQPMRATCACHLCWARPRVPSIAHDQSVVRPLTKPSPQALHV